jgi:cellulose synthase/poly-beta-1,6-N-acetylglucosamine synthase-like glycosyltransferase
VTERPTITVVVCTMGSRREDLVRCFESLCAAEGIGDHEVLLVTKTGDVVDDLVERYRDRLPVRAVHSHLEGLSDKRNVGVAEGRGEIIAYVDDDAAVTAGYAAALLRAFTEDVDCVTGVLEPAFDIEPTGLLRAVAFRIGGFNRWGDEVRPEVRIGANCAFRRSALRDEGPFDLRLGPGGSLIPWGDDSEMFHRFATKGSIAFAPDVVVHHRIQAARIKTSYVLERAFKNGRAQCVIDRIHQPDFWRRAAFVPLMLVHALAARVRGGSDFGPRLRVRRLAGYTSQMFLLLIRRVPG